VKHLGRIVDQDGVRPDPDQAAVIRAWKVPCNRKEMQSFLGLANYYRDFIVNYATKAKPLTALNKASRTFEWSQEAQAAFDCLKEELSSEPVLALPDEEGMFYLILTLQK